MYGSLIIRKESILAVKSLKNSRFLTFIPARSGSVGIKNKNIKKLGNKFLLEHTVNFIKKINLKNNFIYVSTDSKVYLNLLKKYSLNSNLLRSKKNSKSNSKIESSVFEFLNHKLIKKQKLNFDYIILLLPTQPFRSYQLFKKALEVLKKKSKGIISIKNLDRSSKYIFKVKSNKILIKNKMTSTNRQFVNSNFTPCGCFYIIKFSEFLKHKSFFIPKMNYLISSFPQNIDVDSPVDLEIANILYKKYKDKINKI